MASEGDKPLDILFKAMRHFANMTPPDWKEAAVVAAKAAPYVHTALKAIEVTGKGGGPIHVTISSEDAGLL